MKKKTAIGSTLACFISILLAGAAVLGYSAPATAAPGEDAKKESVVLDQRCQKLPFSGKTSVSQLVELSDGSLLTVAGNSVITNKDDGRTWSAPRKIYDGAGPGIPSSACVLLKTHSGELVMVYLDMSTFKFGWNKSKNRTVDEARLDVWSIRSLDEGKTWIDRQQLLDGYCGALIDAIQTSKGRIVVPVQCMIERNRHAIGTRVSDDDGKTWQEGNVIDLGGCGDHAGAMEPTLAELADGRIMMLIRTNLDRFWEAISTDGGRYWREIRPSKIDASSAPGYLLRLASGRLALFWNRLYPDEKGEDSIKRSAAGNQTSDVAASWFREELSLAFSDDEAKTWSKPQVIASAPGKGLSYPYVFERRPGELWVFTHYPHQISLSLHEADFLSKSAASKDAKDIIQSIYPLPPCAGNTRNSEGDFITLADGRILFIYTFFTGGGDDHSTAHLAGRFSSDGGRTWTDEPVTILPNEGGLNTMSVSLLRLADGRIAMFYLRKNSEADCRPLMRISTDEAKTWSEPTLCIPDGEIGYYVLNNDRAVQLKSGRLILPVALHNKPDWKKVDWNGFLRCYISDDAGKTWRAGKTTLTAKSPEGNRVAALEPGVVELKDGRLMMFIRTSAGCQYLSYSGDGGDNWSDPVPSTILSPCSPATIERIPGTDRLLLVWNDHKDIDAKLRDYRTPLTMAVSDDEGRTWKNVRNLYDDPNGWYCYTAMHFADGYVILGHCAGDRRTGGLNQTNVTRIPLSLLQE